MRRLGKRLALALLLLLVLLGIGGCLISERRPESAPSPEADALARRMEKAIGAEAWARTGAVRFNFAGRHAWLWDRNGGRVRLRAGDSEVLLHTADRRGVAFENGRPLAGEALEKALADTWSAFCNDTFWLNPLVKLFDEGTRRSLRSVDGGGPGLLVEYGAGGVTPGDAYLWHVGPDDRPIAWQMWVQILPIGGVQMGWGGWQTLETGAVVSTLHTGSLMDLALTEVAGAATMDDLEPGAFDRLP